MKLIDLFLCSWVTCVSQVDISEDPLTALLNLVSQTGTSPLNQTPGLFSQNII